MTMRSWVFSIFLEEPLRSSTSRKKAASYYQRVIAVNMGFRDAARRLALLAKAPK
jgi:hypothetical protein